MFQFLNVPSQKQRHQAVRHQGEDRDMRSVVSYCKVVVAKASKQIQITHCIGKNGLQKLRAVNECNARNFRFE